MKRRAGFILRISVSAAVLAALVCLISPAKMLESLKACDWRWLLAAFSLMPLFLALRITKWHALTRQSAPEIKLRRIARGYLWGMAIGLITPGRVGELARIWGAGLPTRCTGLFLLEKLLEISALMWLCLLSVSTLDLLPRWLLGVGALLLLAANALWRPSVRKIAHVSQRILRWPSQNRLETFNDAVSHVRIAECAILTVLCQLVFCLQSYLLLKSLGEDCGLLVIRFMPIIFLANLVPITIGGLGMREAIAVYLFGSEGIPAAPVMSAFVLVAAADLFLPGTIGAAMQMTRRSGSVGKADGT